MRKGFFVVLIICLGWISSAVYAQDNSIQTNIQSDRSEVQVGDPVQLTLTIIHPVGYRVVLPEIGSTWGDFDVRSIGQPTIANNTDGTQTTTIPMEVTLFAVGDFSTPELPITVYDTNGQPIPATIQPLTLTVNSILQEGDTTLRDIKGQANMILPENFPVAQIVILVVTVMAGLVLFAIYSWRKRTVHPVIDLREPHEIAFDELRRIESLNLIESGELKEYYNLVSQCIREYVQNGLGIPAMERTTAELKPLVRESNLTPQQGHDLLTFLYNCDLVKFGGSDSDLNSANSLIPQAGYFIESTRPKPETLTEVAEGSAA